MSGIAELLANLGYEVTGSDAKRSDVTERLERLGVGVWTGHDASHVGAADVVVISSAIRADNPEVSEATLSPLTQRTYLQHAESFVRWLKDDFKPGRGH